MLTAFAEHIWTAARPARFWGVETGSRMTVVRLAGGGLFVHSPVALDPATRRAVDALGPVRAVVAPSVFHHLHVAAWKDAYPEAHFAACPGLEWKRPDLPFDGILGDTPHPAWREDLDQAYFSARRENEVVFFHARSRTLICCDALLHLSTHPHASTRAVAWLMGNRAPGVGHLERFMIRDRRLARRQVRRILAWDFDRVVLAHGEPLTGGGHAAFRDAYTWL
jgi:hypothetical protein